MTTTWVILTESGSKYVVRERNGNWFLKADNVISTTSKDIRGREWPIQHPTYWPPEIGKPLELISLHFANRSHVDRMPGGGKLTSLVTSIITNN